MFLSLPYPLFKTKYIIRLKDHIIIPMGGGDPFSIAKQRDSFCPPAGTGLQAVTQTHTQPNPPPKASGTGVLCSAAG